MHLKESVLENAIGKEFDSAIRSGESETFTVVDVATTKNGEVCVDVDAEDGSPAIFYFTMPSFLKLFTE